MKNPIKNLKIKRRLITWAAGAHLLGDPSRDLKIVGVTGTNGKTTVATLLYRTAIGLGYKAGLIGTVENLVNGEKRGVTHTTPDPIALNKLLSEMKEAGCEYVFMEVSSHALDQNRVAGVRFTGGIFTNLTHDHLDYHKTIEKYFEAKKKFFEMLPKEAFALSNHDDDHGRVIVKGIKAKAYMYGAGKDVLDLVEENFHGEILKMDFSGLEISINKEIVRAKLLGKFNVYNLMAVYGACKLLGWDMNKVRKVLENIAPPKGRFDHFSKNGILVIVDYAHTPDALEKVLQTAREIKDKNGRIISIVGCGGDRDPLKRPKMGNIAALLSDIAIFTSDNPRSEDPERIIEQMKMELQPMLAEKVRSTPSRRDAIREAVKIAKSGDIILCAGKGHEDYQEIKGVKKHFDDKEELEKAFNN